MGKDRKSRGKLPGQLTIKRRITEAIQEELDHTVQEKQVVTRTLASLLENERALRKAVGCPHTDLLVSEAYAACPSCNWGVRIEV
jgi:hypothetical protein